MEEAECSPWQNLQQIHDESVNDGAMFGTKILNTV